MRASGLVLWGSLSALALTSTAGGCGGRAEIFSPGDGGEDGGSSGSSSGVSGSSSGFSGSSSGLSGSSSGTDGGGSGSSSGTSGGGSGSSSGTSGSSSGFSGSSSGVSGSSSSSGSSSGGSPNGNIYVEECAGSSSLCQSPPFSIYAQFFTMAQGNGGCTVTTSGSCTYYSSCTGGPQPNGVSAGTLTVSGPWLVPPVSVTPMTPTNTYSYTSSSPGFTAGQTLTVSASGAAVPAFGPVSVAAPQLTSIVQPPVDTDGGTTIVPTSGDLVVVWSGGQQGATMIFEATANNFASYTACTWNAADGKDVVPVAMLKPLSGQSGYLFYGQYNVTSFYSGPYAISLTALPYAVGAVNYQ